MGKRISPENQKGFCMSSGSRKLREERMTAYEGMKAIMDKIGRGERLTVEERADFDARNARITALEADIRTAEEAEALAEAMRADNPEAPVRPINPGEAREMAFTQYLRTGRVASELRDMGEGALTPGGAGASPGYLVPPGWWQRLQVALKAYGGIAKDFEQLETETGQSIQWATVDPTSVVGTLIGEGSAVSTQDYTFGQGVLNAYMYTSGIQKVSIQLANDSAFDIDGFVSDRVGESLGRAVAAFAISGTGSSQPLGIIPALTSRGTAYAQGTAGLIQSGGYVVLGSATSINIGGGSTTELLADTLSPQTLRQMIASVDPAYRNLGDCKFYMNDAQLLGLRGLVDNNGRPLVNLQDGVTPGVPTSVWGYEIVVDNNVPALTASTVGGPVFGRLSNAMVFRTVRQTGLMRLDERYADQLQVGYVGYARYDCRSNDLRAAVTVKANTA